MSVSVEGEQTESVAGATTVGTGGFALISNPVTAVLASDVQPFTVQVAVIEYVPTAVRVKLVPVAAPSDQVTVPAHPLAVNVSVDGEHTTSVEGGVIVGALGFGFYF